MSNTILSTKLYSPPPRPNLVLRPRLTEQLATGVTYPLTLIAAPAGFGKTTLLSEWLHQTAGDAKRGSRGAEENSPPASRLPGSPVQFAWLSLDEADNDPVRFLTYVISALETVSPGLNVDALALLQSPQPPPLPVILPILINNLNSSPHHLVLVLDDYHVITTSAIHEALIFLLDHLPPQLRLILASRTDPPLPLARWRGRNQLYELRVHDLRFTTAEATAFLEQVTGLSLPAEAVAALEQRTEGWIAGLQLAALSMQGRADLAGFIEAFTGSHRYILDYLTDEVLEQRPIGTKDFLLQTSILNRLCGPLCDALTGDNDGQATLERLEQANLFIVPLDDERRWYRYHHLFADVLQARLRQSQPELLPDLHRRASDWYERHDSAAEAVQHALAAGDDVRAAGLIERERWTLLGRGEINTLHTWLDELPVETVRARPRLSVAYGWILSLLEQVEAIEPRLQDAEKALAIAPAETPEQPTETDTIRGEIATLRAETALSRSDIHGAIELCRQALKLLPKDNTLLRGVATYFLGHAQQRGGHIAEAERVYIEASNLGMQADNLLLALHALANLSIIQMALGRLREAAETSQRILQITAERRRRAWPVAGLAYQGLGRLHYEWNDLDTAVRYLRLGIECGQRGGLTGLELNSRSTLAFTLQAQHDPGGADEMLRQIAAMTERQHHPVHAANAAMWEARLRLRQGHTEPAVRWTETCGLRLDDAAWPYRHEGGYLTLARVFIAQGQAEAVPDLLDRLREAAESDERMGSVIEILILLALARQVHGDTTGALTALEGALALAEPEGYIRTFVDEGVPMAALLREARTHGIRPDYVSKLLAAFGAEAQRRRGTEERPSSPLPLRSPAPPLVEALSPRELELLRLVADGHSNQEIAQELFLAVGTVKKHLNNIFGKFGVSNRTQAVARARELDLF